MEQLVSTYTTTSTHAGIDTKHTRCPRPLDLSDVAVTVACAVRHVSPGPFLLSHYHAFYPNDFENGHNGAPLFNEQLHTRGPHGVTDDVCPSHVQIIMLLFLLSFKIGRVFQRETAAVVKERADLCGPGERLR